MNKCIKFHLSLSVLAVVYSEFMSGQFWGQFQLILWVGRSCRCRQWFIRTHLSDVILRHQRLPGWNLCSWPGAGCSQQPLLSQRSLTRCPFLVFITDEMKMTSPFFTGLLCSCLPNAWKRLKDFSLYKSWEYSWFVIDKHPLEATFSYSIMMKSQKEKGKKCQTYKVTNPFFFLNKGLNAK